MIRPALALALLLLVQTAPRASRIAGRVVDAATGRPLAGVVITLNGSALPAAARARPPRVLTDRDGVFTIRGLGAGLLYLSASRFGYVDAMLGQTRPLGSAQPLRIRTGADLRDLELKMWRPAVIAGAVLDEAGEPVVGAAVRAYARVLAAGHWRFDAAGVRTTDDRGEYRLAPLVPGDYVVSVTSRAVSIPARSLDTLYGVTGDAATRERIARAIAGVDASVAPPGGTPSSMTIGGSTLSLTPGTALPVPQRDGLLVYPRVFYPGATVAAEASVLHLGSGEERSGVDLQLRPSTARRVSGTVVSAAGPVADVPIRLFQASVSTVADPIEAAATTTDDNGRFTFPGVPSGSYVVRLVTVLRPPAGDDTLAGALPIEVSDRHIDGLVMTAATGPRVTGRIEFDGLSDPPDPARIANIRIALEPVDGVPLSLPGRLSFESANPEADGTFRTAGVPPGRYLLRVNNRTEGWMFRGAAVGAQDLADTPFDLQRDLKDVVITFSDRACTIDGTVRAHQAPDPTAIVIAFPTDASAWTDNGVSQRRLRIARVAPDGSYTLPPLPPGEYYVAAVREASIGEPYDPELLASLAERASRLTLHEGETRTQDLRTINAK